MPALMRSELPEVARTHHHWIVLFRPPHRLPGIAVAVLFVWGLLSHAVLLVFAVMVGTVMVLRWRAWHAELIILTRKRIVRVQGVPETTTAEASLRIDRVSGARLVQTVPGKMLGYGTIELEAPGNHPDVRRLARIADPHRFYARLRAIVFGDVRFDPDDGPGTGHNTQPLPRPAPPYPPPPSRRPGFGDDDDV